jgi:hypothetical protein
MLGWHVWSWRRAGTMRQNANGFYHQVFELIAECDRPRCTAVKR